MFVLHLTVTQRRSGAACPQPCVIYCTNQHTPSTALTAVTARHSAVTPPPALRPDWSSQGLGWADDEVGQPSLNGPLPALSSLSNL